MKMMKRMFGIALLLCLVVAMVSVQQINAADIGDYILEEGNIELGAKYLIVAKVGDNSYALSGTEVGRATQVTVGTDNKISSFDAEDYYWVFDEFANGYMSAHHNGAYLAISTQGDGSLFYDASGQALVQYQQTGSEYKFYLKDGYYYGLYLPNNGTDFKVSLFSYLGAPSIAKFQLYKLDPSSQQPVVTTYNISYDNNGSGSIAGLFPTGITGLSKGDTYTIPQLSGTVTRKDGDNTYEFAYWTDDVSGNGKKYYPGDSITVDKNLTLYAQWKEIVIDESLTTSYVLRYLVKGTYEVLHEDSKIEGVAVGSRIYAEQNSLKIEGYTYCGATIDGVYISKEQTPHITLSDDASNNVIIIHYIPDPDLHLHKEATLENNGTYTVQLEMFTHDNPVTTVVDQNLPLDIVMVLDQSSSMWTSGVYDDLQNAVESFINLVADHGRTNEVDHRIAVVGYGNNNVYGATGTGPIAGSYDKTTGETTKNDGYWTNTGVFDVHGDFHTYPITGFTYEDYNGEIVSTGTYYTYSQDHNEYLLLDYLDVYRHLITEDEAYTKLLQGEKIYGYVDNVDGHFTQLTRNANGMWVYEDDDNNKQLYTSTEFFTWHENVWTHRHGLEPREIHAYMIDGVYTPVDGHDSICVRKETTSANPDKSIYKDALIPVTMGAQGSGFVDPCFERIVEGLGAKGETFVSVGIEMANSVFEANPLSQADVENGRQRVVVVFTDGKPGDSTSFDEEESNNAIYQSFIASGTYGAEVFTVGMYGDEIVNAESDQDYFMNGLSSNYPEAESLEDVWNGVKYITAQSGVSLDMGGPYYVKSGEKYCLLENKISRDSSTPNDKTYYSFWRYTDSTGKEINLYKSELNKHPIITAVEVNGEIRSQVNGVDIYRKSGNGYQEASDDKYYFSTHNASLLEQYFATILRELTTKVSTEIMMKDDAILRDIMGQGLELVPGSVITVYSEEGTFIPDEKRVEWSGKRVELDSLVIPNNASGTLTSQNGILENDKFIPYITVYNIDAQNPTNPNGDNYHPHTVDVVGYKYDEWFLNAEKPVGSRLVVIITKVEAQDDVAWGHAQTTNHNQSGLWLSVDANGSRELLEVFNQPSTVFVERTYVLDYGKEFVLSDWYFDSEGDKSAGAIHVDCEVENGMNWFDENSPTAQNGSSYGNTQYGNVRIDNNKMYYQPITTQWGGYDQFYVFGNTWRNTVVTQSANTNGNLWNKVVVIPANNIYYEDSFVTSSVSGANDISGFVFTGEWEIVYSNGKENAGLNKEDPEHVENAELGGGVHGWTDGLNDDKGFSDGSAHLAGGNKTTGAKVVFNFTGTGVDVYTRTNEDSGIIVAMLKSVSGTSAPVYKALSMDNLAKSGDYYQIPTVTFEKLEYGTYEVTLIATSANKLDDEGNPLPRGEEDNKRYEYYLDGIRVYNPLGAVTSDLNETDKVIKDAYGKELNAINTEIRDIVLNYASFYPELDDVGATGAVFVDWIQEGQGANADGVGTKQNTYEISTTYKTYGPKNELYLASGQAIVLKVDPKNSYYIGLKSLDGKTAQVGIRGQEPKTINVGHTIDMYYEVVPSISVEDGVEVGYITVQNLSENEALLGLTKLRTTNLTEKITTNGVLPIMAKPAVMAVEQFDLDLEEALNKPEELPETELELDPVEKQQVQIRQLFANVSDWLEE